MVKINMRNTGELLQQMCKTHGYKPKDLSILFNVDITTPYYWFSGKVMPSWNTMINLAKLLGTTIDDLLIIEEDDENE